MNVQKTKTTNQRLTAAVVLTVLYMAVSTFGQAQQLAKIETTYRDGFTTVTMAPLKISGEKAEYYSLHFATSFKYDGQQPKSPEYIDFQIQTVVKSRYLNPDLYIVFLIDGETVFLSSNRSSVNRPVQGRRMIGERIAMRMPLSTFLKLANAKQAAIKMGGTVFPIDDNQKRALLEMTTRMSAKT